MRLNKDHIVLLFLIGSLFAAPNLHAQSFKVDLSPKNLAKVAKGKSAFEKLKIYRKAYSKDSARQMKQLAKKYKKNMDSVSRVYAKQEKLDALVRKKGIKMPVDTLAFLKQYGSLAARDSTGIDTTRLKQMAKGKLSSIELKELTQFQKQYGFSPSELQHYLNGDSATRNKMKQEGVKRLENISPEQKRQMESVQRQYGLSFQEAEQYMKGDSAARRKIAIGGLKKIREKSLNSLHAGQRKQLESFQKQYGPYSTEAKQYIFFLKDSVDRTDTIKALASKRAEGLANQFAAQKLGGPGLSQLKDSEKKLNEIKNLQNQYQKQFNDYKDTNKLKEKAEKEATEKFASKLQSVAKSMSLLKNKYSSLLNSNDLSTGIKAKSLKGTPLRERWVIGGNFNVVNVSPFLMDLSPVFGYRVDKKLQVGVGVSYRISFADSVKLAHSLSAKNYGYSSFVSYTLLLNFFAYGEGERTSTLVKSTNAGDPKQTRQWVNSLLIGVGRQFNVTKYAKGTVMLLWNPLHENGKTPYKSDFVIKTGFRLSESALKKP